MGEFSVRPGLSKFFSRVSRKTGNMDPATRELGKKDKEREDTRDKIAYSTTWIPWNRFWFLGMSRCCIGTKYIQFLRFLFCDILNWGKIYIQILHSFDPSFCLWSSQQRKITRFVIRGHVVKLCTLGEVSKWWFISYRLPEVLTSGMFFLVYISNS